VPVEGASSGSHRKEWLSHRVERVLSRRPGLRQAQPP